MRFCSYELCSIVLIRQKHGRSSNVRCDKKGVLMEYDAQQVMHFNISFSCAIVLLLKLCGKKNQKYPRYTGNYEEKNNHFK